MYYHIWGPCYSTALYEVFLVLQRCSIIEHIHVCHVSIRVQCYIEISAPKLSATCIKVFYCSCQNEFQLLYWINSYMYMKNTCIQRYHWRTEIMKNSSKNIFETLKISFGYRQEANLHSKFQFNIFQTKIQNDTLKWDFLT